MSASSPAPPSSSPASKTDVTPGVKRKAEDLAASDAKKPKANASITAFFGAPKPVAKPSTNGSSTTTTGAAGVANDAATKKTAAFDKEAWVKRLDAEQKELLALEINTLDESWLRHLTSVLESREFLDLKKFLRDEARQGKKIFPPSEDVYSWSRHTPLNKVKAVILGQDPYHNLNQAHGLCFSVRPPQPAPPSLKNIYIALKKDYPEFKPPPNNLGLLTPWADSGVLLLNASLTVRAHEPSSHSNRGWEKFTQKVIDTVVKERRNGVVFLAWGSFAHKRCVGIDAKKHLVLKTVHPSPLSARNGFFDCGHFKKANDWLSQRYGVEGQIDWNLNVKPEVAGT